jgi:hypothetical protein
MKCCEYDPWCCIHNPLFSSQYMNGPHKLECYIIIGCKGFTSASTPNELECWRGLRGTNTPAYWPNLKVTKKMKCCEYGPWCCIHNTLFSSKYMNGPLKLKCYIIVCCKGFTRDKHSSLLV